MNKVRTECVIIGPEKLAELLRERLPDLYAELAFPGGTLGKAVLRYVSAHQEAAAFDLSTYRPLDQFYVNVGLTGQDTILDRIADGYLRCSTQMGYDSLPRSRYSMIMSRYTVVSKFMKNIPLFQLVASKTNKKATDYAYGSGARELAEDCHVDNASPDVTDGENDSVKLPDDDHEKSLSLNVQVRNIFLERFLTMLDDYFSARSVLDDPKAFAETLQLIHYADRLVDELSRSFQDLLKPVPSNQAKRAYNFRYKAVKPEFLLEVSDNVCIVGDAGAGKTSMARILAQKAVASGTNCVYFPCSRIQRDDCHLLTEIQSFLLSINAITPSTNFDDLLDSVELFILDGCDEAATYKTTLGGEIQALVYRSKVSVAVNLKENLEDKPVIQEDLSNAVKTRKHANIMTITLSEVVMSMDLERLILSNVDTVFEKPLRELKNSIRSKNPRFIITTRNVAVLGLSTPFLNLRLIAFDDGQMDSFFGNWFGHKTKKHNDVRRFLKANAHIKEICRNPMVATIVAALCENDYDLPQSRSDIYEKRFDLLLRRWDRIRGVQRRTRIVPPDKLRALVRLALSLHRKHKREFTVREFSRIWEGGFAANYPGVDVNDVLWELRYCNNLIYPEGSNRYSLGHLSFQEFLAAKAIVFGQKVDLLISNFYDPWWREVIIFYAGITGDIHHFVERIQENFALENREGLFEEMMFEARYTPDTVKYVIRDILASEADNDNDLLGDEDESDTSTNYAEE